MTPPTPLVQSRQLGRWRIHALQAGGQQLDGGAMFGVVPKPLWEKRLPADGKNRIPMGMRCLLVEHDLGLVLIDTGAGHKEDEKFYSIYGIENGGHPGPTALEDAIRAAGHSPADVAFVINTHLHFDHAGGNTVRDADGTIRPAFPNATYVVQLGEYLYATHTNERTGASYFPHNFVPLFEEKDRLELVSGTTAFLPGIELVPTPGHTPHHQSVMLRSDGEVACFLGDVCPTVHHLPLPWIMGYDVEPLVTLETKRWLLKRAMDERWLVIFEHDAHTAWGRVGHDGKSFVLVTTED
jgi:glyoxylase-like metal-dependent hydrolase (beta-lactamase superfamily II)